MNQRDYLRTLADNLLGRLEAARRRSQVEESDEALEHLIGALDTAKEIRRALEAEVAAGPLLCEHGVTVEMLCEECAIDRRLRLLALHAALTGRCPKCSKQLVQ